MEVLRERNRVYVSEVDNPFVFPAETRYTVGNGVVLAERSMTMNVTDRNFGQYPVYVFTSDGVFALSGSGEEVVHGQMTSLITLVCPISSVVCNTPFGIVYVSDNGLMLINQYRSTLISSVFGEQFSTYDLGRYVYPPLSSEGYVRGMYYVPNRSELVVLTSEGNDLVYSFRYERYHAVSSGRVSVVENGFPHTYVLYREREDFMEIRDENEEDYERPVRVRFETRPLRLGWGSDVKHLLRVILRGWFRERPTGVRSDGLRLLHSNSGRHMLYELPKDEEAGNKCRGEFEGRGVYRYRDVDSGLLVRERYRYYAIRFEANLFPESEVEYLELLSGKRYWGMR